MKWLGGIANAMDMSLSSHQEMVKGRKAWRAAVHEVAKSQQLNNNNGRVYCDDRGCGGSSIHLSGPSPPNQASNKLPCPMAMTSTGQQR